MSRRASYLNRVQLYECVRQRLLTIPVEGEPFEPRFSLVEQAIAFLRRRAELPCFRPARLPGILREVSGLTYYRYGEGTKDLFRDLFEKDSR